MSRSAAQSAPFEPQVHPCADAPAHERFLPLQLAQAAEAAGRLIFEGLVVRGVAGDGMRSALIDANGDLRPEVAPLARAYEAALLVNFTPSEVATLRRLLSRVEAAALRLAVPPNGQI